VIVANWNSSVQINANHLFQAAVITPAPAPLSANPYVRFASATQVAQPTASQILVPSALVPVISGCVITLPLTANTSAAEASIDGDLDAAMENLLESLSQQVGAALWNELGNQQ